MERFGAKATVEGKLTSTEKTQLRKSKFTLILQSYCRGKITQNHWTNWVSCDNRRAYFLLFNLSVRLLHLVNLVVLFLFWGLLSDKEFWFLLPRTTLSSFDSIPVKALPDPKVFLLFLFCIFFSVKLTFFLETNVQRSWFARYQETIKSILNSNANSITALKLIDSCKRILLAEI